MSISNNIKEISKCHIIKVTTNDIANGPGIRVTVWVSGCAHKCAGCHNPDTWKWNQGKKLTQKIITKILDACKEPHIQGLTITGGDPFFIKNREGVRELCKQFRMEFGETKDIWIWTGYTWKELKEIRWIPALIDFIVDGKYEESLKDVSLTYAGSKNQKVIDVLKETYE